MRVSRPGFTLIELLMVAAIISLLSSVIFNYLGDARAKARDSERIQEMRQLRNAMELYQTQTGSYPPTRGFFDTSTNLNVLVPTYIQALPRDPSLPSGSSDRYYYCTGTGITIAQCETGSTATFAFRFVTERSSALGNAGVYCLTGGGFHSEESESDASDTACEQR